MKDDGGPAFPSEPHYEHREDGNVSDVIIRPYGMSLRDKFADSFLRGPLIVRLFDTIYIGDDVSKDNLFEIISRICFGVADAMLKKETKRRTTMTMKPPELGKVFQETDDRRDAIHVAVMAVVSQERLAPGQDIGRIKHGASNEVGVVDSPIGIVDPFLSSMVYPEQGFWMLLYPGLVDNLRHHWDHADLPESSGADEDSGCSDC